MDRRTLLPSSPLVLDTLAFGFNSPPYTRRVTVATTPDVVSGPTTRLVDWVLSGTGPDVIPGLIDITAGNILLHFLTAPSAPRSLSYVRGSPTKYLAADGSYLADFDLPVPFP